MKIAVICYEYPPIGGGGGRAARDVARHLVMLGHEVRTYTAALRFKAGTSFDAGVTVRRLFSFRLRADRCSVPEMGGFLAGAFIPSLIDLARWRPDVIHAHFAVPSGALAFMLSRILSIPFAITAQLGDVPGAMGQRTMWMFRLLDPLIRPIWRGSAARSACSSHTARLAEMAYGLPVEVIYNGIDIEGANGDARVSSAPPAEERRFIYAGRFDPQKNLPLMIEGFVRIPQNLKFSLDLVGDGADRPRVEAAIRASGLGERVRLHGWLTPEETRSRIEKAEVLVMTSRQEGLPLVALEALRAGLAIVGSNIGGLDDVLSHEKNGIAFKEGDAAELGLALERMIVDKNFLISTRRESLKLAQQFSLPVIARHYEKWLHRARTNGLKRVNIP